MSRKPIRTKVQNMVLAISIAALIIASAVGIISMMRIQGDSERALISQMEQNLDNITISKANLAEAELGQFSSIVEEFASYIHELYVHPENYKDYEVFPPSLSNAGIYAMQRSMTDGNINVNDVIGDVKLLGNLRHIWDPIIRQYNGIITVMYIGTEKGFMLAYDQYSDRAVPQNGVEEYYDYFKSNWYNKAKSANKTIFTEVYQDGYDRGLTITCATPFYNANNDFIGVVAMDILISDLYKMIVELDLGEDDDAYAFLVDGNGNIIDNDKTSEKTNPLNQEKGINSFVVSEILAGKTGVSLAKGESHFDYTQTGNTNFLGGKIGVTANNIYFAYTPIKSTGWKFCVRIPESLILAPVRSVQRTVIFTILLFLVAFLIIISIVTIASRKFAKKLTKPIISLSRDVKEISSGNLDYRAKIHDNDEIGDLAKSFNDMAVSLKDYIRDLAAVTAEK
ncbi:MAG: HAMP domain-containing protein, partial [Synergistaceae bacterium]|nr:HAMP domain-containing protein [Synergistaceae bacterium]